MSEMANYAEYSVIKKYEGKYQAQRILMIAAYFMFPVVGIVAIAASPLSGFIIWFIAVFPLLLSIIIPLTYRYVQIEYEYRINSGLLSVDYIFGRRSRKAWLEIQTGGAEKIAPYTKPYAEYADGSDIKNRYVAVSTMSAENIYFIVFNNAANEKSVLFFEPSEKILKIIKFYNRGAVITEKT